MADDLRPVSALPSVGARVVAFCSIVIAGLAGGLIGYAFVGIQCHGSCSSPKGVGAVVGAMLGAGGVAIVAVLVMRAMGEWRTIKSEEAAAEARRAARAGPGDDVTGR